MRSLTKYGLAECVAGEQDNTGHKNTPQTADPPRHPKERFARCHDKQRKDKQLLGHNAPVEIDEPCQDDAHREDSMAGAEH